MYRVMSKTSTNWTGLVQGVRKKIRKKIKNKSIFRPKMAKKSGVKMIFSGHVTNQKVVNNGLIYLNMHFQPNRQKKPSKKPSKTLKNGYFWHKIAYKKFLRFFSEKPPCTFLALIVVNLHAKNQENRQSRFLEKLETTNY